MYYLTEHHISDVPCRFDVIGIEGTRIKLVKNMSLGLVYKNAAHIFDEVEKETPYLEYPLFQKTGIVTSAFSTRLGGVSEGYYSSLNLSFDRGDDPARVLENFKRIGASMGVNVEDMVLSKQTHTTNVRVVTAEDKGKGVMRERNYTDVDGMITNVPGICLVTSYADCVPLYFVDPVKKAIGLSHSGWRGTVGKIGKNTVQLMQENFGSKPEDLLAAVGPSVCMDCYEVSEDVIEQFKEAFEKKYWEDLFYKKENGKYQLNLWEANRLIMLEAGIKEEHISMPGICTCCNPEFLFSHRASHGKRGNLGAFLGIRRK